MSEASPSQDIAGQARRHLIQPWEPLGRLGQEARTVITRGEGLYVYDGEGRRLIDGPAGMWCVQIGYGRPEMAQAIAEQALALPYYSPWYSTTPPAAVLAERIARAAPGDLNHVFFTTGGSTAVDSALRFAAFYNNVLGRPLKKRVISRAGAYHGSTWLSASCSGKERDKNHFDFADQIVSHLGPVHPYRRPEGMSLEAFCDARVAELEERILALGPETVAAFVAEPILASGGVIIPPPGYHRRTLEVCRKYEVLYIADEVVTAFGRLGHLFASEAVFDTVPDIITFAKGVSSGYVPLGGFVISDAVLGRVSGAAAPGATFSNGYTYSGHPLACAAGLKSLEIIEREGLLEHVRRIAPYFQARLASLEDLPLVGEVRGMGLMACVECVADRHSRNPLALDREVGARIDAHCQALGLIVRPMYNMCVLSPPLIVTESQIDAIVEILREGIERTQRELRAEGLWRG